MKRLLTRLRAPACPAASRSRLWLLAACLLLTACAEMPDPEAPAPPPGPAPQIVPLGGLLAQMPAPGATTDPDPDNMAARASALRARAASLRGPLAQPTAR